MRPTLAMVAAAVLWSTSGLFIKVASLDAVSLSGWRSAVAAATLFALARAFGHRLAPPRDLVSWVAALSYALMLLLFVASAKLTTAANAIFLQYTAPMYVLLFEPLVMKTRLRARDLAFVAVAIGGMAFFFVGKIEAGNMKGNALALASGVCFAVFALAVRSRHGDAADRWRAVAYGNLFLVVGLGAYMLVNPSKLAFPTGAAEVALVGYLGVVQIGLAYALFAYAISKLTALESTLVGMIEPLLNPVWVFLGTGERPSSFAFVGAALIVGSVATRALVAGRPSEAGSVSQSEPGAIATGSPARGSAGR